jgi:hypothetical protein
MSHELKVKPVSNCLFHQLYSALGGKLGLIRVGTRNREAKELRNYTRK